MRILSSSGSKYDNEPKKNRARNPAASERKFIKNGDVKGRDRVYLKGKIIIAKTTSEDCK